MPRIVCISDTHNISTLQSLTMPEGDILVHAGDLTMSGSLTETMQAADWLKSLDYKYKLVVAGNHDFYFEKNPREARALIEGAGCIYLNDEGCTVMGIRFWGSPVQPWFYNWAFNRYRGPDIDKHWTIIPNDIDVLITHGPPCGILDWVGKQHVGCEMLTIAVDRIKPKLHVFGHIHCANGIVQDEGMTFVNASIVGEDYKLKHEPYVVTLEK